MEFLVMPKFTDSLIECYSADDSCTCYNGTLCNINCPDNGGDICSCNIGYNVCTCRGVRGCTGLACFTDCPLHIGVTANNPTK